MIGPNPNYPVPNCAQVVMQYTIEAIPCENVYNVAYDGTMDAAWMTGLATVFQNWENTTMKSLRHGAVGLQKIIVSALTGPGATFVEVPIVISGTGETPVLPNHCTFAVKLATGRRGRSYRGRSFFIGLHQGQLDVSAGPNFLTATAANAIVAGYQALITNVNNYGAALCVLSRRSGGAWLNPPQTHIITTAQRADLVVDSQRRRLPNHNRGG